MPIHLTARTALSSARVDRYVDEVRRRNHQSFHAFAQVGAVVSALVVVLGQLIGDALTFQTEFALLFVYFLVLIAVDRLVLTRHPERSTWIFYLALHPLIAMGIAMGTFLDPTQPSITIMVMLCVLTIFLLDKPLRVVAHITIWAVLYAVCCYLAKEPALFQADMIDLVGFYFLAVGVNCFSLSDRIDSVENYIRFREKSETDLLTGLYNRGSGVEKIEALLAQGQLGTLFVIDVDDFKSVNDTLGHAAGDEVLVALANCLRTAFFQRDVILRLGGDEFAVFSPNIVQRSQYTLLSEEVLRQVDGLALLCLKGRPLSLSVGCAPHSDPQESFETLYQRGDAALYEAKAAGKDCFSIR